MWARARFIFKLLHPFLQTGGSRSNFELNLAINGEVLPTELCLVARTHIRRLTWKTQYGTAILDGGDLSLSWYRVWRIGSVLNWELPGISRSPSRVTQEPGLPLAHSGFSSKGQRRDLDSQERGSVPCQCWVVVWFLRDSAARGAPSPPRRRRMHANPLLPSAHGGIILPGEA